MVLRQVIVLLRRSLRAVFIESRLAQLGLATFVVGSAIAASAFAIRSFAWPDTGRAASSMESCLQLGSSLTRTGGSTSERELASEGSGESQLAPRSSSGGRIQLGMFGPDHRKVSLDDRVRLYRTLDVRWLRTNAVIARTTGTGMTDVAEVPALRAAGFRTFVSVHGAHDFAASGAGDISYRDGVTSLIDRYRPDIVAVENEIDGARYTGSPSDYLARLKVACDAAHLRGAQCTDGGFTTKMNIALLLDEKLATGDAGDTEHLRTLLRRWYGFWRSPGDTQSGWQDFAREHRLAEARQIVAGLKRAGADYVNLHWYTKLAGEPTEDVQNWVIAPDVAAMLSRLSGLPVIGGEIGLEGKASGDAAIRPESVTDLIQGLACAGVAPQIWWNPGAGNFPANPRAASVVSASGGMLSSADGFRLSATQRRSGRCPDTLLHRKN